jgi:predicted transposase/invertase (TIGR01784 family)
MLPRYIDPTTDFGFKRLFGQEDSKEILKAFLEATLDLPRPIAELTYMPAEQLPTAQEERTGIYDVYCVDSEGQRFIVEMQRARQLHFKERSLYYVTFPIVQQVQRGKTAFPFLLLPVYCVAVLNFPMDDDSRHLRRIQLRDSETGTLFYDKLTFVYIELPKFHGALEHGLSPADQWVYLLRHMPALMDIPTELDHEPFTSAFDIARYAALSSAEQMVYERSLQRTLDERAVAIAAREEGREEGRQEGLEQGRQEGMKQAKFEMARTMLAQGIDRATVAQVTGLSADELAGV